MPTELDVAIDNIIEELTAPGQMFELTDVEQYGQNLPNFKNAPANLAQYFTHFCQQNQDMDFLVEGDKRMTFGECWQAASHVAHGLATLHNVQKGDRIGIAARNSTNWIIAYMGIIMSGGCATLLNGFWTGSELAYGTELAECKIVLADTERAKRMEGHDHGATILPLSHEAPAQKGLEAIWAEGDTAMKMLGDIGPEDPATILYTSGSTGRSKGAWSDHRGVVAGTMSYVSQSAMAAQLLTMQGNPPSEQPCALVAVPLFHVTGEVPLFLQSFGIVRKLVLMPKWDAKEALRLMEKEKVSYFVGVPLMSYEIATHPEREQFDISACKGFAAGGAPRPVDHVETIKQAFPEGYPLLGYGLTETNGVGCGNFNENYMAKPGSTGRGSRPMVEIGILDDDGKPQPQGQVAEICIRSVANFRGYWNNEKATNAAFTEDGFFRSGDLGYLDQDDYLFIVDRKKDIIIRGGENISCIEVEAGIYAHEGVAECSVFGLHDDRYGEIPAAVYLMKEGASITPEDMRAFMSEKLASFKVPLPEHIWQAEAPLPRLGTQKIDKRSVREMFAKDLIE